MSNYFDNIDLVFRSDDLGFANLSENQKRKITAVMNMWDEFLMLGNGSVVADVRLNDLKGFLFYRVVGKGNGGTYEGKSRWTTFLASELKNLVYGVTKRYGAANCHFTDEDINGREGLRAFGKYVSTLVVEKSDTAPARALTLSDKDRLLSCLSFDGLGCRDRLIIELMYTFGLRSVSISGIQMMDIQLGNPEVGRVSIFLRAVKGKSGCRRLETLPASLMHSFDDYYRFRLSVFPDSPHFFISKSGKPMTSPLICEMFSQLSVCAGYGRSFFTGHSPRFGFASMIAAEVFATGGELIDVMDKLRTSRNWGTRSTAVLGYIDMNIHRFFVDGLSFQEFKDMPIVKFHQLRSLGGCYTRKSFWMRSSRDSSTALSVGRGVLRSVEYVSRLINSLTNDDEIRTRVTVRVAREIGQNLFPGFIELLNEPAFVQHFEVFVRTLCNRPDDSEFSEQQRTKRARSAIYHVARNEEEFDRILTYVTPKQRKFYRIVCHPSGDYYTLSRPRFESNVDESRFPDWPGNGVQGEVPEPEGARDDSSPLPFLALDIGEGNTTPVTPRRMSPSPPSSSSTFQTPPETLRPSAQTPSTAASLSSLLRGNSRNCL
jgi:hypothetical protein